MNEVIQRKISERREREPTNFIYLFEILRFNKQFLENCVFDGQLYTRQAGEWLKIHTRKSKILLAMASVASVISTPAYRNINMNIFDSIVGLRFKYFFCWVNYC